MQDGNSALGQKVLHIPQAQTEAMIQPNSVTDYRRRKSVSMVQLLGIFHACSLADLA